MTTMPQAAWLWCVFSV